MNLKKIKFYLNHFSFLSYVLNLIKVIVYKSKFIKFIQKLESNYNYPKKKYTILAPLIETSHSVHILLMLLLKYLELRGNKIILLLCDQSLSACEIKNCFSEKNKFVCSKCKSNRRNFVNIFKFQTLLLSNFKELKPDKDIPDFKSFNIDINIKYKDFNIHRPILDSVYRFFYGKYNEDDNDFKKVYYKNLYSYLWIAKISEEIDRTYSIDKVISFMTAYSSWHPIFEYFRNKGNRFVSLSLNQFNTSALTVNFYELYPAKKRFSNFKFKRGNQYLDHNETKILNDFLYKRISNQAEIFVKDNYFDEGVKLSKFIKINKSKKNIFLFSNIFWDIGISDSGYVYDDVISWIFDTINYLKSSDDVDLYIKPHPAEISEGTESLSGIESIIREKFDYLPKNIFFIKPEWKIKTYDLFNYIDLGLIFNGTLGLELLYKNIPVVSVAKTPSFNLDLMYEPKNKKEYYNLLTSNLSTFHNKEDLHLFMFFYFVKCSYPWVLSKKAYGYTISDLYNDIDINDLDNKKNYYLNHLLNYIESKNIYIDNWKI